MHSAGFRHLNGPFPLSHFVERFSAPDFNLTFPSPPTPFVWLLFCNSCYYRFWSAVIAGGKIGPDGVLLCMNGELEELGLNRPSLNGVYAPPACLGCGTHITVARAASDLESDGKVGSWVDFPHSYWSSMHQLNNAMCSQFELIRYDTGWACSLSL